MKDSSKVKARLVGVMELRDRGEQDDKLIAVALGSSKGWGTEEEARWILTDAIQVYAK